jgi:hypothetical protein
LCQQYRKVVFSGFIVVTNDRWRHNKAMIITIKDVIELGKEKETAKAIKQVWGRGRGRGKKQDGVEMGQLSFQLQALDTQPLFHLSQALIRLKMLLLACREG